MNWQTARWMLALVLGLFTGQQAYAFYNPTAGRWLNRDPIEELDGPNLYAFVHDNPANRVDKDGTTGWQFNGPWEHDYCDPKCPGPDETDAAIALLLATLITPVPGDEAVAGAVIVKRLESVLNKCKPCKNIRCDWKIFHRPHHWFPAPTGHALWGGRAACGMQVEWSMRSNGARGRSV